MKRLFLSLLVLTAVPVLAQTGAPSAGATASSDVKSPPANRMMAALTPAERDQVTADLTKALAQNPDLQQEESQLRTKWTSLSSGDASDQDREAFQGQVRAHAAKVRAAMLKVDPSVAPVLAKVDSAMSQR